MAPNGHCESGKKRARNACDEAPASWLDKHGQPEYDAYKRATIGQCLSFDAWKRSNQHTNGLSLYYKTLDILDESDSTDGDDQTVKAKVQPPKVRGQVGRPRKSASTAGNGVQRSVESAKSSSAANAEDLSPSAKKKRKARKKPLEIVASGSDSGEGAHEFGGTLVEAAESPITTVASGRKSSTRKAKKKPISEETISPDDEVEDPMEKTWDEIETPAKASPLPVRPAHKTPAAVPALGSPKKTHILKLSTRKTPKERTSPENIASVDGANVPAHTTTPSTDGAVNGPTITVNTDLTSTFDDEANRDTGSAAASPDTPNAATGSTRRGLRTRKPAQQRPYYHDSQLFEHVEPTNGAGQDLDSMSHNAQSRRVSATSLSRNIDDALLEAIALLEEEPEPEPTRPKHFKGKGRAWKKEGSDEDEEFSLAARKKAAKAAKLKAKGQVPKKRGRPRKSGRSEEVVEDEIEEDKDMVKRKRPPPRKSALSEEIVPDSSDDGEEEKQFEESTTPKYSPKRSYTPTGLPAWVNMADKGANKMSAFGTYDEAESVSPSRKST
ncbi:predicted protein [Pyrenophora tritici-repentis Pt-1C-BFP]|uniref:Uncharacterized protein n=1 Tax=Pyrenophora tritici-repentis (strain Pt-1C-BFP) TaxID=426418 RepID=B2VY00_PYRTR|nr:uncharacterized protein PTRG_03388 [Pyrenophora tritici-repentis Pt-1C-BFP]EDU45911.1 predicted protein [Pyrenophora tritici-repentis Pt-1C-BFP]